MIEFEAVRKTYDGRTDIVRDLSLNVRAGEMLVLMGPSGCGKTTTLKMINRLVEKTSGTIRLDGESIDTIDRVALRRRIGYAFQGIGLFPHRTVAQNIATVPTLLRWSGDDIRERVDELLELVKLPARQFRDRLPRELSGGQQQRVGFARALAARPKVMLLDEPFGALDPLTRDTLQAELRTLQAQLRFTAVLVTHDMTEALLVGDRIAVMNEGRIVRIDTPRNLFDRPGDPFVEELLAMPRSQAGRIEQLMGAI